MLLTRGALESAAWLRARGLASPAVKHWYVEITLRDDADARFELKIYPEEWGFVFRHGSRVSSVRVTDVPFVHGSDDFRLKDRTPALADVLRLVVALEEHAGFVLDRRGATVHSNLARATSAVHDWLDTTAPE